MITLAQQIREVQREIARRERAYPLLVQRGRMSAGQAAYALALMQEVLKTLERLEVEQTQISLRFENPYQQGRD